MANIRLALILIALAAGMANAVPTEAFGYVTDQTGSLPGIAGANVTVECGDEQSTTISDHKGFYYRMMDCDEGETITATAQKGNHTGSNSDNPTINNGYGYAEMDIQLQDTDVQIPEYPSTAIPALISILSFGLVRLRNR